MKKVILISVIVLLLPFRSFSQAPELREGYSQLGFDFGYGAGRVKSGPTLGIIHINALGSFWFYEFSGLKLSFFNEKSESTNMLFMDLITLDIGFGTQVVPDFYLGISPFSINLTQSPDFGISVLAKYRFWDKYVLEGKLVPYTYHKVDFGIMDNNFYLGAQYWLKEKYSFGIRYNRYDFYSTVSLMTSWTFM